MAKIICIDDDRDILDTTTFLLKQEGHETTTAMSGKEGFEKARAYNPDLIILDVMMEDNTAGFHTAYNFRKDEKLKHKPILMLTSVNQKLNYNFSLAKGGEFLPVDAFVEKPIIRDTLLTTVKKLLSLPVEEINVNGRKK